MISVLLPTLLLTTSTAQAGHPIDPVEGLATFKVTSEPVREDNCQYYRKKLKQKCLVYVEAVQAYDDDRYADAERLVGESGLAKMDYAGRFLERIAEKLADEEARTGATLDPSRVSSIEVTAEEERWCPGESVGLSLAVVLDDGSRLESWGESYERQGKIDPASFTFETESGEMRGETLWLWNNVFEGMQSGYAVTVSLSADPSKTTTLTAEPVYDCLHGAGSSGARGSDGQDGADGDDVPRISPYGGTQTGGDGANGSDGRDGSDGPDVVAHAGFISTPYYDKLLIIKATAGDQVTWYVGPPDQSATVWADGGHGGDGGDGGDGGTGSTVTSGDSGTPGGGGDGGNGANGGNGGDGGSLTILYDARHPELATLVVGSTGGGGAGDGGSYGYGGDGGVEGSSNYGPKGNDGSRGERGSQGAGGAKARIEGAPASKLFSGDDVDLI
jgi:hypothetical protein